MAFCELHPLLFTPLATHLLELKLGYYQAEENSIGHS
jgi:hypothetical protein